MVERTKFALVVLVALAALTLMVNAKEEGQSELKVISVATAFNDSAKYDGKLGLEGTVGAVDAKKVSFEIFTPNPPGSCTEPCCAPKHLPVSVPKSAFTGKLPKNGEKVVVVGDFKALTVGFDFKPREVRRGGKVILSKKS